MADRLSVAAIDDDGWLREEGARWGEARDGCPHPDLLAVRESELLDSAMREALSRHLRVCDACTRLSNDLDALNADISVDAVEARVLARVHDGARTTKPWRREWAAAAALLLAVGFGAAWWMRDPSTQSVSGTRGAESGGAKAGAEGGGAEAPPPQLETAEIAANWTIEAPAVRIPMSALGASRSGGAAAAAATALADALVPFRAGKYTEAIPLLDAAARAYPDSVDASFYLGVACLLADRPAEAIAPLEHAAIMAKGAQRDEIYWYQATAEQRTGRTDAARARLAVLCATPGAYRARACAAARALR